MYQEEVVLCGASAYNQKFYINENFKNLPDERLRRHDRAGCYLRRLFRDGLPGGDVHPEIFLQGRNSLRTRALRVRSTRVLPRETDRKLLRVPARLLHSHLRSLLS